MKITKIDVMKHAPTERGWGPLLCRIYTDEGIYGDGEVALNFGGATNAAFGMMQDLAQLLIGMNPLEHEVIWHKMYRTCFWGRNGGPIVFGGISAFDIALWDIKGKAYGCPVYELLGGKQREVLRAYASQTQNGWGARTATPARTPEDYAREAKKAVAQGYDAIKTDFFLFREDGGKFDDTEQTGLLGPEYMNMLEARIAATREAIGPNVDIILENHCYTDAQSAVQMGNMAKKYGIFYFEEPTTPHADLLAYVHRETGLPVASGERIYSRWQYNKCFQAGGLQVAQPDIGTSGGITEVKKICDLAFAYESAVQIHVCGSPIVISASLQLECTIPNFIIHEHNAGALAPTVQEIGVVDVSPVNGKFTVPNRPGIGNEISDSAFRNSKIVTFQ